MRTYTEEKTVYTIQELKEVSEKGYEKAFQNFKEGMDYEWWEGTYEYFDTMFSLFGLELNDKGKKVRQPAIYFSGFWSQGDGASFEGKYSYKKGWKEAIKKEYPSIKPDILKEFQAIADIMKKYFYKPTILISKSSSNYCHSYTMNIEQDSYDETDISEDDLETLKDNFRGLADYIYHALEKEYDYQTSEESFIENCDSNEYEFDEFGNIEY